MTRGLQRAMLVVFFALLAAVYLAAWLAPAIGLYRDDADYLVTAKAMIAGHGYVIDSRPVPIPQTDYPPLFPALVALFALVSDQPQWLKLLPLACSAAWLVLTRKLLLKMGASHNGALLLTALTAASPAIVSLSTNLFAESLFALLLTAALLALLQDRALMAGAFAGLATLTRAAGAVLIVACILTLVSRRRFRSALFFSAIATVMVAPWFGWSLAHVTRDYFYGNDNYVVSNILTSLPANEKLVVLSRNFLLLLSSPFAVLTGIETTYSVITTILVLAWSLVVRRQLVPDLFVALYGVMLVCRILPPERSVAPIFPLILWMVWRVLRLLEIREALAAAVLIAVVTPLWADFSRLPGALADGYFQPSGPPVDNWNEMQHLFGFIRGNTARDSILVANLDPVFYLNTGRKTVRGFSADGFALFYAPRQSAVTPDGLLSQMTQAHAAYVVLTPDYGLAESASFHRSVEALERGGVLEPLTIPGSSRNYRLLKVAR